MLEGNGPWVIWAQLSSQALRPTGPIFWTTHGDGHVPTPAADLSRMPDILGFLDHGRSNEHSNLIGKFRDSWINTPKEARETRGTANPWGWAALSQSWLGHGSQLKVRELEASDLEPI